MDNKRNPSMLLQAITFHLKKLRCIIIFYPDFWGCAQEKALNKTSKYLFSEGKLHTCSQHSGMSQIRKFSKLCSRKLPYVRLWDTKRLFWSFVTNICLKRNVQSLFWLIAFLVNLFLKICLPCLFFLIT